MILDQVNPDQASVPLGGVVRSGVAAHALDLIGNTPLVDVSQLSPNPNARILAKLEMQNPFGSVKDRIAKAMIEAAERDGRHTHTHEARGVLP